MFRLWRAATANFFSQGMIPSTWPPWVNQQANVTERVEHRVVKGKTEIVILPSIPRNTAQGREAAVRVGRLFEAPVRFVEDPNDATRFADRSQKTPPRHSFGREKRSLGNGGKGR